MSIHTNFFTILLLSVIINCVNITNAQENKQEAPDALIKRLSHETFSILHLNKNTEDKKNACISILIKEKIFPYIDTDRMTLIATGPHWTHMTPAQKKRLCIEFRDLLIYTYSNILAQLNNQNNHTIEYKTLHIRPTDTDIEIQSRVIQLPHKKSITLNYRLVKQSANWKIYNINIMGMWLAETYRETFNREIAQGNTEGLIKFLAQKNKQLTARAHTNQSTKKSCLNQMPS